MPGNCFFKFREIDIERVWPEHALFQKLIHILDQSDLAKLAFIIESEPIVVGENKEHSRVPARRSLGGGGAFSSSLK
jgi:hypothetical protein